MIDVSDLYDSFHAIAQSIWRDFGASVDDESWDDIIDSLEMDLFLAACAHRFNATQDQSLEPDEIPSRIKLVNEAGEVLPGAAGQYHSHAFYPDAESGEVPNAVMTGNLLSKSRNDVALIIAPHGVRRRSRGAQLPMVS